MKPASYTVSAAIGGHWSNSMFRFPLEADAVEYATEVIVGNPLIEATRVVPLSEEPNYLKYGRELLPLKTVTQ